MPVGNTNFAVLFSLGVLTNVYFVFIIVEFYISSILCAQLGINKKPKKCDGRGYRLIHVLHLVTGEV